jgi:hypothetical protein
MKVLGKVASLTFLLLLRKMLPVAGWRQHPAVVMRRPTPTAARIGRTPELLMHLTRRLLL